MADMYGVIRSNWFRVKDPEKFREWFKKYWFGEDVTVFDHEKDEHKIAFGAYQQYPEAHPRINDYDPTDAKGSDGPEYPAAEMEPFAAELREHLEDGEVFYVVAGGHEKLRYVGFSEFIVTADSVAFRTAYSDMPENGRDLFKMSGG